MAGELSFVRRAEAIGGKRVAAFTRDQDGQVVYEQVVAARGAENLRGVEAVTSGATVTLVTKTVGAAPALFRLWGFRVWAPGTDEPTDAKAWVEIEGLEALADELCTTRRIARVALPAPELVSPTVTVTLKVYNRGASATFAGVLLGE